MARKTFTRLVATFFGLGFLPLFPATWASAVAAALGWYIPSPALIYCVFLLSVAGFSVCRPSQDVFNSKDPKPFVMDEVCGMMLSVLWLPKNVSLYVWAFIMFRVLDVWKPWPISRIQESKFPSSILWDDLAAGLFTNLVLQAVVRGLRS